MDIFYEHDFSGSDFPFLAAEHGGKSALLYHWHDEIELVCILDGPVDAGIHNRMYHLQPGEMLLIGSGETHCFFTEGDSARRRTLKFSPQLAMPLLREGMEGQRLMQRLAGVKKCSREWPETARLKMQDIAQRMYEEFTSRKEGYQLAIRALIYDMMLVVLRELPEEEVEGLRQAGQDSGFKRALCFLQKNYTSDISLKDCADAMGFNMNYFSRFFRTHTGINFHEYLTTLRLRRAEWLLTNTALSVTEIVGQSGFQNVKTFNRVFKKAHACSPREFRRQKTVTA